MNLNRGMVLISHGNGMHDVVVYLSSLPRIADRNRKVQTLRAFYDGVSNLGLTVHLQESRQILPARLAVILGWVGTNISGPHIQLRRDVIDHQTRTNGHVMVIDGSCFKFADNESRWLRYSLGGVFYNTNNYANRGSSNTKWNLLQRDLGLDLLPWRSQGRHILICLQRDGGWNLKGIDMEHWTAITIKRLRTVTDRPILVRPHPRAPINAKKIENLPAVTVSQGTTLQQDVQGAWCSVFFNSSSCVASILAGIPVISLDRDCVAWEVSDHTLAHVESPSLFDRQQWLNDLCACHWNDNESRSGAIYQHFDRYLR